MSTTLAPFVPPIASELAAGGTPSWTSIDGSMLSADISGFTALSERLAGKGKAGAEEITELINVCFTALIEAAHAQGGEVLKFGGDALLVLFRGDRHRRRAADAGLAMQRALAASATAKRASLTMTVGVADGPFDVFLVGSGYRELLVSGGRASEVIRLEGEAPKGGTLVAPAIAAELPDAMLVGEVARGVLVTGSTGDEPPGPRIRVDGSDDDLRRYVPESVVEQLAAFAGLGGEHRLVTVGFVMVTGIAAVLRDDGPDSTAAALGHVVDEVVAACRTHGATLLHSDIAPDGVKLVLCAGAPINPGDTADALLQTALRIRAVDAPFTIRQGVQTGRVFAGFLGSEHRRTYTLMGDPVNTAARMLGKAGDREIVAVASVVDDTRAVFLTEPLEPFLVKGKAEPILAHRVDALTGRVRRDSAGARLVGRRRELDHLTEAIGRLGRVVEIVGPAGVGKSRLLDAAWDAAEGLRVHQASCTPYGATIPYSVFRPLLRGGTGIPLDADPQTAGALLADIVTSGVAALVPMLPLLAVPFGAQVPPTPEVDAISPEYRRARLHDVVLQFLDAVTTSPILLVAEDAHWIDDASGELLHHLVRAAAGRPWCGIVTRRDEGSWRIDRSLGHVSVLELAPLTGDDVRRLAVEVSSRSLSDAELDLIEARAGGNPLFAVELARAVRGPDGALPDSVEGLIASRLDALGPTSRRLVRLAAVFGNEFAERHLRDVASTEGTDVDIDSTDLAGVLARRPRDRIGFHHALYRDVAYEGLPFRQRRRLHEVVADTLERSRPDPRPIAGLLSLHFHEARRHREAYRYATQAADDAMSAFAHREAGRLLQRALAAGRHCRDVGPEERAQLYEHLGRSLEFSGELDRADEAYRNVRRLTDDLDRTVGALRRQARVRQKQNHLTAAIRMLRRALRQLDSVEREPWVHRRLAELHLNLSGIRMDQGRLDAARAEGELAESHAIAARDDALRVQAYGAIAGAITDWSEAERLAELGLGPGAPQDAYEARSILAINLGMCAFFAGRWDRAVELYETGRVAADAMGNVTAGALATMNAAEVLVDQGRLDHAAEALAHVQRVLGAAGYDAALLYADMLRATIDIRSGRLDAGVASLSRCATQFRDGSMLMYALEADLRIAEARLRDGDPVAATAIAERSAVDSERLARRSVIRARADRLRGIAVAARGDLVAAAEHLSAAVATCRSEGLRYELALALDALADAGGGRGGRTAERDEANRIFAELGVDRTVVAVPAACG